MKNLHRFISVILSVILVCCIFSSCGKKAESDTQEISVSDVNVETPEIENAVKIVFSGESAQITGSGAKSDKGTVTITSGGTYALSGSTDNGRVIVNAPDEEVTIVLCGVNITSTESSAIYIYKSKSSTIYVYEGTENTLTDAEKYSYSDEFSSAEDEEPNACVYSKSDLIITGEGKLTVNANYGNGITGKDTLAIEGADITLTAADNGINGKDYLSISNSTLTVKSGGDAIRSTNDTDTSLGYITAASSTLTLNAGEDGIQAETKISLKEVTAKIQSGGGYEQKASAETSSKGIKAGSDITISGSTLTLSSSDDAIHSNSNVTVDSGTITIYTGDDGIHADENLKISGGTITVKSSYEGLEANTIDITGGTIDITSTDDGMNAAGGNDQSGFGGMMQDNFGSSDSAALSISGGKITVTCEGDGLDSNGKLLISGGEIYVNGPTSSGNGALDYGSEATITGGTIVAAGSSGMAVNFGSNSTQGSILLNYQSSSKDTVKVTDSDGNTIIEYTPTKSYNSVVVSSPKLTKGGTYKVTAGGETQSITLDSLIYGESSGMGMGGGMRGGNMGGMNGSQAPDFSSGNQGGMRGSRSAGGTSAESETDNSESSYMI